MHFCFGGGNALKNGMERQGSGGNGSTSSRKAHMGRNEPFDANTKGASPNQFSKGMARLKVYVLDPSVAITRHSSLPFAHKSPPF